jgi:hypothetical protein
LKQKQPDQQDQNTLFHRAAPANVPCDRLSIDKACLRLHG